VLAFNWIFLKPRSIRIAVRQGSGRSRAIAVAVGALACEGTGRKSDPYRYWFPASEARWREQIFMYDRFETQRRELGLPFQSLQERKAEQQRDHDLGIPGGEDD
jgi:hypothetical protein